MVNKKVRYSVLGLMGVLILAVYSCASVGTPNGGPYDETPPKFVSSTPAPNQTNYTHSRIEIMFDELIQLDRPSENVIVTPPQKSLPIIRASGRKILVELKDTLQEKTTYTLDFTNSIADNNEKNILENFTFAFSTGEVIDSLEVSGILLNAENLEPMPGITIGLHRNLEDSAFTNEPFLRTSRTNDRGQFTIRNIAPGTYRIYGLNDVNRDYLFDQPGEDIAFCDSLIVPTFEFTTRQDTTWVDTLTIDTIQTVAYTRFMPDDIRLFLFKEKFARQYILRPERSQENMFILRFNAPLDTIPTPVPLNFEPADSSWFYVQTADEMATLNFWITDSTVWTQDTLQVELTYPRSDSLNILQPQTDTLQLVMRRSNAERRRGKKDEPEEISLLGMNIRPSGSVNNYDTVFIAFDEPVLELEKTQLFLEQKVDTLWNTVDFELHHDSVNALRYYILRPWKYDEEYKLEIDSATIFSVYGKWNNKYSGSFKIKSEEEYGHLYINIIGVDSTALVELLDNNDVVVRKAPIKDGGVLFLDLKPNKYYARIILDTNKNGKWDTGNYAEKLQPETVYYYPKFFEIPLNWQVEETWNVLDTPIERQKPLDITKNKPKEATKPKRDYRDEGRSQQSSRSSGSAMGLPF
ncbi:Ig-like domain-containing protein [Parabacteroides sp. PF5-9]|uniref:Ig-like domain-containing protein n=1 Tax=Parabacteroides sp. PF5-9 TaxID=1742404 RepID=UPI0024743EA5|nr:Ig-like domain-containing protein [Parabacteroides sp. PF5-9]MDH6357682.1 hypothetical protein [Parabacteroides sp. PF5-9]